MPPENPEQSQWFADNLLPHESMLRGWLKSRFSDRLDIDEVIQESYIRILKAHRDSPILAPKAFLFATARNFAINAMRAASVRGENLDFALDDIELVDEKARVAESVERNQELEILTKAIQSLPDRCRQIFTLRKVYGMPQRDIAKKLGISPRTVNAQISIGVNKCVEFVEGYIAEGPE